jgi:hypothetical protein
LIMSVVAEKETISCCLLGRVDLYGTDSAAHVDIQ